MEDQRHYAVTDEYPGKVEVRIGDITLASSTRALILKEVGRTVYNPVFYIPKEDVQTNLLQRVEGKQTHCPIKGDATYWDYKNLDRSGYFAWSYENPLPRSKKITEHIAFNLEHVTFILSPS